MSFTDKVKNESEELTGKAKQAVGRATDNESLVVEGEAQESAAQAKKAGEHVKDAGKNVRDARLGDVEKFFMPPPSRRGRSATAPGIIPGAVRHASACCLRHQSWPDSGSVSIGS